MGEESTVSGNPENRGLRSAQLLRAGVLLLVGFAIAFTATMHEQLGFDVAVVAAGLGLIGIATLVEYSALRATAESWWVAARAVIAVGAAGSMLAVSDTASLALVIAIWAALTALITLMRLVRGVQPLGVALPSLLLSVLLAIAVLVIRGDQVAVIGVFGTYTIIRGVFLAIAAFDPRPAAAAEIGAANPAEPEAASAAQQPGRDD